MISQVRSPGGPSGPGRPWGPPVPWGPVGPEAPVNPGGPLGPAKPGGPRGPVHKQFIVNVSLTSLHCDFSKQVIGFRPKLRGLYPFWKIRDPPLLVSYIQIFKHLCLLLKSRGTKKSSVMYLKN